VTADKNDPIKKADKSGTITLKATDTAKEGKHTVKVVSNAGDVKGEAAEFELVVEKKKK
jgi:hypothetical protein